MPPRSGVTAASDACPLVAGKHGIGALMRSTGQLPIPLRLRLMPGAGSLLPRLRSSTVIGLTLIRAGPLRTMPAPGLLNGRTCAPRRSSSIRDSYRLHLSPTLGTLLVPDITEPHVRRWRKNLLDSGVGPVTTAKAYRLLKAILNTAVDDGLIRRNPCRINGAGQEKSPERPVLTVSAGLRPGRRVRSPVPAPHSASRLRQPALGRAGRAAKAAHRPGRRHRPH